VGLKHTGLTALSLAIGLCLTACAAPGSQQPPFGPRTGAWSLADGRIVAISPSSEGTLRWRTLDGRTYGNPDFVKYAESYGAHGHRVTSAEEMPALLKQCLDTPGVHVVEVPIDYADNDRILNKDVRELSAALPV